MEYMNLSVLEKVSQRSAWIFRRKMNTSQRMLSFSKTADNLD